MTEKQSLPDVALARLARPLALTRLGMVAERLTRSFWPFVTVLMLILAALALGFHETLPVEGVWAGVVGAVLAGLWTFVRGVTRFLWPSKAEALDRLDRTLPGRPITALSDTQAIGAGSAASEAVWRVHVGRMAERASGAKAVEPDLRVASRDPFALRYIALTIFVIALLFGSIWRIGTVGDVVSGPAGGALASGPAWEGWIEPPSYTGRPSLYLNDIADASFEVPAGSSVTVRLYGEVGALTVSETVSGRTGDVGSVAEPVQEFEVSQNGAIEIDGPGGKAWDVRVIDDLPPAIELAGDVERAAGGEMRQPFTASDDYGVLSGRAEIALNLASIDRRYGLSVEPEDREPLVLDLPMTITGDRTEFTETLVEDLSEHPWANLPVTITLIAEDASGQTGRSDAEQIVLPGLRFFDPLAAAVIEQRRDLLWTRDNLPRVIQILRTVTYRPDDVFRDQGAYLQLRVAIRRMEAANNAGGFTPEARDEMAAVLWDIALLLEFGDLANAVERLRRAQDRLSEAIRNGASEEEIAELMQELREAMQDYMNQLAQQNDGQQNQQTAENMQEITGDQLQEMLDEIQRLMEEGRMAEAQALLDQLMQMMQNMQVVQGESGGQQSPGQQAMEGLAETLRNQQDLSDEAFRDLQEQYNPGQQGQQGQGQNGQQGQEGQGQQQGQGQGEGDRRLGEGEGGSGADSLSDRQRALRRELERQTQNLPGAGTPEGDAARDSLGRAGRAMENAEESLENNDLAGAIDDQAEAMDALREGMRDLGDAMAQEQRQQGQQGQAMGEGDPMGRRDPLGRDVGNSGRIGTDESILQGDDIYRRAEELLDEIRRRSGDQSRPEVERNYLERLLDRF